MTMLWRGHLIPNSLRRWCIKMSVFSYQAKNERGQIVSGTVDAENEKSASQILWENKLKVISIAPKPTLPFVNFFNRVSITDKSFFVRQLATMISAGLHLSQALTICSEQTKRRRLKEVLDLIIKDVEEGYSLSSALSKHPDIFDPIFVNVTKAGEASGRLEQALLSVADRLEKDARFIGKVKASMTYPIFVVVMILVVGIIVMLQVIPQLKSIFQESNVSLPWTTKAIIATSDFLLKGWWGIILGIIVVFLVFRAYLKTEEGGKWWGNTILHLPIFGELERSLLMTRFLKTFSLLVKTGIPLLDCLHLLSGIVGNEVYRTSLYRIGAEVEKGVPLSTPISQEKIFPLIAGQMIKVGEQTGKLDEVLERLGNYYEDDVDKRTQEISDLIEPIVIVILGIGVAIMFAGVLMPIYQIAQMQ